METSLKFIREAFKGAPGYVYLCALRNKDAPGRDRKPYETAPPWADLERGVENVFEHDGDGVGLYFGIATRTGRNQRQEACVAMPFVALDIDHSPDLDASLKDLLAADMPPSRVHHSGHGLHAYWYLKRASKDLDRMGRICLAMACKFGGDRSLREPARLLRLPGSHNTKGGDNIEVKVVHADAKRRYDINSLATWLESTMEPSAFEELEKFARSMNNPVDLEAAMSSMTDYTLIPDTRRTVVWAAIQRGVDPDELIKVFVDAAMQLEPRGARWTRDEEEKLVAKEIERVWSKLEAEQ